MNVLVINYYTGTSDNEKKIVACSSKNMFSILFSFFLNLLYFLNNNNFPIYY